MSANFATCNENGICDADETNGLCPEEGKCGDVICSEEESFSICSKDCPYTPKIREGMSFWERLLEFITGVFF
ncbi:MAG: hypothetical protein ABIB71_06360 [Candidatus Woesearchaeota archaeon]